MDTRSQVKPGALVSRVSRSRGTKQPSATSVNACDLIETRDLRVIIDNLRKDSERKDSRNDKLSKDMVNLRTIVANQEREIRILNNTLEKITSEKSKLSHDYQKTREVLDKTEQLLTVANDTDAWEKLINDSKKEAEYYKLEAEKLKGFTKIREENMTNLEKEVQILRRTLKIQRIYESEALNTSHQSNTASKVGGSSKDVIKALYYDLGKCQNDNHDLAIALADKQKVIDDQNDEINALRSYKNEITPQIEELLAHVDNLTDQSEEKDTTIKELQNKISTFEQSQELYEQQINSLAKKLSEIEDQHSQVISQKDKQLEELQTALPKAQRDAVIAQGRADILQQAIIHHENQTKLSQQRLEVEWSKLLNERAEFQELNQKCELLTSQVEELRSAFTTTLLEKDSLLNDTDALKQDIMHRDEEIQSLKSASFQLENEYELLKKATIELREEHEDGLNALQQTMQAFKELTVKYKELKGVNESLEKRTIEAEKAMDNVKRSKEHVSTAVLDALHKERLKSASLEKILQEMPVDRRYYSTLENSTATPNKLASQLGLGDDHDGSSEGSPEEESSSVDDKEGSSNAGSSSGYESKLIPINDRRNEELARLREALKQIEDKAS